ncbi:Nucleoside 2-deoxyribosyltransferase [Methanomethylovorans hollandica DSM 15978]|uniref:Putative 2'-deoxynucleoside 5'-phosphate N-hydrolase 1 n=1 Tax=Methanomethylovorans hollandica (strain DSM 15978 / NBRC 107637 / DMS1) TaxID=867904 RepID=L0KWL8_METHD|nr:nucleoside 2-deoxyribosyltransferase [Methanomethylovorans hollandica]AGB48468.1 Nucleoside 2-deoxyribosyltransferase [Methanomethylovorans hollandica DSM 15978]
MKVFFSGSIRGGRELLSVYQHLCSFIVSKGHEVLTEHVADPQVEKVESAMTEQEIFARDMALLEHSSCLIAEVSIPSTGVGYEICSAVQRNIPVLCLYRPGANVSAMVLGNPYVALWQYSTLEGLDTKVLAFLISLQAEIWG